MLVGLYVLYIIGGGHLQAPVGAGPAARGPHLPRSQRQPRPASLLVLTSAAALHLAAKNMPTHTWWSALVDNVATDETIVVSMCVGVGCWPSLLRCSTSVTAGPAVAHGRAVTFVLIPPLAADLPGAGHHLPGRGHAPPKAAPWARWAR
jgi:hypothetical protein